MNEYGYFTHEDGLYQERVRHIQLGYASYTGLLALYEITSLLREKDDLHVRVVVTSSPAPSYQITRKLFERLHGFYTIRTLPCPIFTPFLLLTV